MMAETTNAFSKKNFYLLVGAGIILNATGLFSDILEPDSALYASIAKRIVLSGDWIGLYSNGSDWLDKPHFPFWISAISFKFLGINAFAYKLPAFLFWLASARFTYLVARLLFNSNIAAIAVIIYMSSLHTIIANFDVRAEPYLTCCTIGAIYYICRAQQSKNIKQVLLAALFCSCAVMTKGIFILASIGGGHILYWIITKDWKQFISYKWWLLLLLVFIFILPELYCLYMQFDMHPEKIIYGKTGVSGIRFFFWDSQFGRFFNTGPITGSGTKTFFLHTILWAFLPWAVLFYIAVVQFSRRKITMHQTYWIIFGGSAITFLLFSFSSFQLPHYIIIIFPQLSIISAAYLADQIANQKITGRIFSFQVALLLLLSILLILLAFTCRFPYYKLCIVFILPVAILSMFFYRKKSIENILVKGMSFAYVICLFLNLYFYPQILQYQSGMLAAKWIKEKKLATHISIYKAYSYSFTFYAPGEIRRIDDEISLRKCTNSDSMLFYIATENIPGLIEKHYTVDTLKTFDFFPVSKLNLKFLNFKTRPSSLKKVALARILLPNDQNNFTGHTIHRKN